MNTDTSVQVRDLMQRDVLTLAPSTPMSDASALLEEYGISGAPVVDEATRCVLGVLSASDVVRRVRSSVEDREVQGWYGDGLDDGWPSSEGVDYESTLWSAETNVAEWMTARVISVDPDADLRSACQLMTREGVHRVLVTEEDKLLGILSSMDVVKHLSR